MNLLDDLLRDDEGRFPDDVHDDRLVARTDRRLHRLAYRERPTDRERAEHMAARNSRPLASGVHTTRKAA